MCCANAPTTHFGSKDAIEPWIAKPTMPANPPLPRAASGLIPCIDTACERARKLLLALAVHHTPLAGARARGSLQLMVRSPQADSLHQNWQRVIF